MQRLPRFTREIRKNGKLLLHYLPNYLPIPQTYEVFQTLKDIFHYSPYSTFAYGKFANAILPDGSKEISICKYVSIVGYLDLMAETFQKVHGFIHYQQRNMLNDYMWPFNTIRINRNIACKVHRDSIMLPSTFSCMSVFRSPDIETFVTIFPELDVSIDLQNGDMLIADLTIMHGNTVEHKIKKSQDRFSIVAFCT